MATNYCVQYGLGEIARTRLMVRTRVLTTVDATDDGGRMECDMKKKLAIFGSGGYGCEIKELAEWRNTVDNIWSEIVFIDDVREEGVFFGIKTMHFSTAITRFSTDEIEFVVALGDPTSKIGAFNMIAEAGYTFGKVVSPNAIVSSSATLGDGVIVQIGAMVEQNVVLERGVSIGNYVEVGHDTIVGEFSHIGAKTNIGGENTIGRMTFLGLQTVTREKAKIGSFTTVGMGSIVVSDLPDKVIAFGNPARIKKTRSEDYKSLR